MKLIDPPYPYGRLAQQVNSNYYIEIHLYNSLVGLSDQPKVPHHNAPWFYSS